MRQRLTTPPAIDVWLVAVILTTLVRLYGAALIIEEVARIVAQGWTVLGTIWLNVGVVLLVFGGRIRRWVMHRWFDRQPPEPLHPPARAPR